MAALYEFMRLSATLWLTVFPKCAIQRSQVLWYVSHGLVFGRFLPQLGPLSGGPPFSKVTMAVEPLILALVKSGIDLTPRQMCVVMSCHTAPQTVKDLAASMSVNRSVITRAVDRLVEFDYVTREDNPTDRRSILVRITAAGCELCEQLENLKTESAWPIKPPPSFAEPVS